MSPVSETAGRRILVVEDEMIVAMFVQDALAEIGCDVVGAASRVEQAMDLIDREDIDAAVLDLNLGRGQTSYPIAEALAARGIPFVFSTGYGEKGLREDFRDRPLLTKPFKEDELTRAVTALLDGP